MVADIAELEKMDSSEIHACSETRCTGSVNAQK